MGLGMGLLLEDGTPDVENSRTYRLVTMRLRSGVIVEVRAVPLFVGRGFTV